MSPRQFRRAREKQTRVQPSSRLGARAGAGAALGATVLFAPAAQAQQTFVVDTLADHLDGDCSDGDCTLREAINDANTNAGELDTITFAAGLTGTITIDDAAFNEFAIDEGVTIQGPGASVLAVSGADAEQVFYVNVDTVGNDFEPVTISGLTVRDGNSVNGGGGLYAANTTLTLANMVFTENEAGGSGGAVSTNDGKVSIVGSQLTNNYTGGSGGALYTGDTEGSTADDVEVLISDSVLSGNSADGGGALYLSSPDGDVVFENSTFSGNTTVTSHGGGVYIGGVYDGGDMTIRNSTVSGNEGEFGAGILIGNVEGATLIANTTVSGNVATDVGGGVYLYDLAPDQTNAIRNSTIVGNTAGEGVGGGVYVDSPGIVEISSTIIANNTAATAPDLGNEAASEGFDVGFSLIGSTSDATITESPAGSNLIGVDPQLGPLANNGGTTQTHAPAFTSPVLEAGIANGLGTDQRGAPRTFDATNIANRTGSDGTDIGSVELLPGGRLALAQCKGATENLLFAPGTAIVGTDGDDVIVGTDAADTVSSGAGADLICLGGGNDGANTGAGKDRAFGEAGKDRISGKGGKDTLKGGAGKDTLKGQAGKDKLSGQGGADTLKGGGGADTLKGGAGKDKLRGGPGRDKLRGGAGKDSERQ